MLHVYVYRFYKKICRNLYLVYTRTRVWLKFRLNNVHFGTGLRTFGIPVVDVWIGSTFTIGNNFSMNSGDHFNLIGRQQPCFFIVQRNGVLRIGDNVGISGTAIVCHERVTIGDNVKIGGNVVIYDTDFHSLDPELRRSGKDDLLQAKTAPVTIENDAFIGAHSTILKGVTIGKGAVIGAGSVVTKVVPPGEVWAGNPARRIKSLAPEAECIKSI